MSVVEMRPGRMVWLDGDVWSVVELGPVSSTLTRDDTVRRVATGHLAAMARVLTGDFSEAGPDDERQELIGVLLGSLTPHQVRAL